MLFTTGGGNKKVNPERDAVPPAVVKLTDPVAPVFTIAVIVVDESTWKDVAEIPPKVTAVVPFRLVPVMVRVAPGATPR
jgi:hypothetical protein